MMYRAKATHVWRIIQALHKNAILLHDANDVWYDCKTEAMAKDIERANEAIERAQQQANYLLNKILS